jgi:CBS domain-containing protein
MITQTVGSVIKIKDIQELFAVSPSAKVAEAVALMSAKGIGAVVIRNAGGPVEGILTERDLMRRVLNEGRDPKTTPVTSVMSREVRHVAASATVEEALRLMVVHRHRHLVVEDGGQVQGLVSIRDLMSWLVLPEDPIAHEGRVGVIRARTQDAMRSLQGKPAGNTTAR